VTSRRALILGDGAALLAGASRARAAADEDEVSPTEDLMREHGVFQAKEQALLHGGFEKLVVDVARIEHALGIGDLAKLTPA
jgi:hypothetical protein